MGEQTELRDMILRESNRGNVVLSGLEGLGVVPVDALIAQPADGILYDLNRSPEVVLTFLDSPKWVNDFAVSMVIQRLKEKLDEKQTTERPLDVEANPMVSAKTAQLAYKYWQTIEDEEHPYEASQKGFTARELGTRRTVAHDALMTQLRKEGFTFRERGDVTEWTQQFVRWVRGD